MNKFGMYSGLRHNLHPPSPHSESGIADFVAYYSCWSAVDFHHTSIHELQIIHYKEKEKQIRENFP